MKKVIFCSIFTMLCILTAIPSIAFAANENEGNNSRDGTAGIIVNDPVYGSIANGNDSDRYALYVLENGYVSFCFDHSVITSTNTCREMYLYRSDGVTQIYEADLYWAIPENENKKAAEIGSSTGTYYIRIELYLSSRYDTSTYTLRVNHLTSNEWEKVVDSNSSSATMIPLNRNVYGSDWYSFSLKSSYGEWTVTKGSACTESENRKHSYIVCDNTVSEKINPTGYTFGAWVMDGNSTCTDETRQHCDCGICGFSDSEKSEKKTHDYKSCETAKESPCAEEGVKQHFRKKCCSVESKPIEKIPHEFGDLHRISGSIFSTPIVPERKCVNCEEGLMFKDRDYKWVALAIISSIVVVGLAFLASLIYKNGQGFKNIHAAIVKPWLKNEQTIQMYYSKYSAKRLMSFRSSFDL